METRDVLIVGGGPAGSSCAWRLKQRGVDCIVLDKQEFPRTKLCAGWITPDVIRDLNIDVEHYPHGLLVLDRFLIHAFGRTFIYRTRQYSIRRYEFDHWLLKRAAVPVVNHEVRRIERHADGFMIDDEFRCRFLVGAGGTLCPVYRTFFRTAQPRVRELQVVAMEQEFAYDSRNSQCQLWFFDNGLPGYSWYVPKADGYVNVGIGGMKQTLTRRGGNIKNHWDQFTRKLCDAGLVAGYGYAPRGYSYYLRAGATLGRLGNAFVVGDAAGLATRDLGEGIGPAVRSGLLAADAVIYGTRYVLGAVAKYTLPNMIFQNLLNCLPLRQ